MRVVAEGPTRAICAGDPEAGGDAVGKFDRSDDIIRVRPTERVGVLKILKRRKPRRPREGRESEPVPRRG